MDAVPNTAADAMPPVEPRPAPKLRGKRLGGYFWGTGRRKTSVARVRVREGTGTYMVNDRK